MKKTIKILSVLLSLCMLLALLPAVSLAETLDYYAVYYKGELTFCYGELMGTTVYCQSGDEVDGSDFYTGFLNGDHPWSERANNITSVTFLDEIYPTSTADWFYKFKNLQQINDLENLRRDNLTTLENMFYGCSALTSLNFGNSCPATPPNTSNMFAGCTALSSVYVWDYFPMAGAGLPDAPSDAPYTGYWTTGDGSTQYTVADIEALSGTKYVNGPWVWETDGSSPDDPPVVTGDPYAVFKKADGTLIFCVGTLTDSGVERAGGDTVSGNQYYTDFLDGNKPWDNYVKQIKSVTFLDEMHPTSTAYWFQYCYNLTEINNIEKLKSDDLTDMTCMFSNCSSLKQLDLGNIVCDHSITTTSVFENCTSLSRLILPAYFIILGSNLPSPPSNEQYTGNWIKEGDGSGHSTTPIYMMSGSASAAGTWVWESTSTIPTELSITPNYIELNVGESVQLVPTITPDTATGTVAYMCSSGCVSVNYYTGEVTALSPGSFSINCWLSGVTPVVSCNVTGKVLGSGTAAYAIYKEEDNSLTFCRGTRSGDSVIRPLGIMSMTVTMTGDAVYEGFETGYSVPWEEIAKHVKTVTFLDSITPVSTASWFSHFSELEQINGLDKLHTESVTNMFGMFFGCEALQSLDISLLNTGNVGDMEEMFACCSSLESLDLSNNSFDFGKLNNTIKMLGSCDALSTLILPKYFPIADAQLSDPPTNTQYTGYWIKNGDTSTRYSTSDLEALSGTYDIAGTWTWEGNSFPAGSQAYAVEGYNSSDDLYTLTFCVGTLEADGVHRDAGGRPVAGEKYYTGFLTETYDYGAPWSPYYSDQSSIEKVVFLDEIAPVSTAHWFSNTPYLSTIVGIEKLNTSNVTDMNHMFGHDKRDFVKYQLKSLDVSHFDTHNVKNMYMMFENCAALENLDVSGFDTSNVEDMTCMFECCESLTTLDVSNFNTSSVTEMDCMFAGCEDLTTLDVSRFDTSNVYDMRSMFAGCQKLTAVDVSHFNTEKVGTSDDSKGGGDLKYMFSGCIALKSLDLSSFKIGNITDEEDSYLDCMLENCTALSSIKLGKDFRFTWTAYDHGEPYEVSVELPDVPTTAPYTGNWIKVGGDGTQYTSQQLMSAYDGSDAMVGTWIWEGSPTAIDLSGATVTAADCVYTGSPVTTTVTVVLDGVTLRENEDYTLTYANNTDAGTARVTVTGIGAYTGSKTVSFNIRGGSTGTGGDLSDGEVLRAVHTDAGDGNTATYEVVYNGNVLLNGTDYTLSIFEYIEQNKVVVTATGIGAYYGSVSGTFNFKDDGCSCSGNGCSCGNSDCMCEHGHTDDPHDSGTTDESDPGSKTLSFLEFIKQLFQKLVAFFKSFC